MALHETHKYDDIIDMPHHVSRRHPQMSRRQRAAQFMPFAALKGHDERVREVSSTPCTRIALADDERETLNDRLVEVIGQLESHPYASITYFQPEGGRDAGEYMTAEGAVRRFDQMRRVIVMEDGTRIALVNIVDIRC
mgnify:CR=1 FL=1